MAAKKAIKSRTSKKSSSKTNLKWWYVLPVVAIVAVAGYAIVRFSEASVQGLKTVDSGINCSLGTIVNKQAPYGRSCSITNAPGVSATATWNHYPNYQTNNYGPTGNFCATVFFGKNATIYIRSQLGGERIEADWSTGNRVTKTVQGNYEVCDARSTDRMALFIPSTLDFSDWAKLEIKNISGVVTVLNMYVK